MPTENISPSSQGSEQNFATYKRQAVETMELTSDGRYKRKVRSFTLRTGRFSEHQRQMMNNHWQEYGVDFATQSFDLNKIFANSNPVILEIGFGMGKSLVEMAKNNSYKNYLGIEVHTPGVGACIAEAVSQQVKNLRVVCHDAVEVLQHCIPDESLAGLQLFFPDPWHKARHHKRRLVQRKFLDLILPKLAPQAFVHFATDWENYAEQMLEVLRAQPSLRNTSATNDYIPRPTSRPLTKFEERGQNLGHGIWDLYFIKS